MVSTATVREMRLLAGGAPFRDEGLAMTRAARRSAGGEFYMMLDPDQGAALRAAWAGRGLGGSVLITPHPFSLGQVDPLVEGTAARRGLYGGLEPSKQPMKFIHSKTFYTDGEVPAEAQAMVTSAGFDGWPFRWELTARLRGEDAHAVYRLADSAVGGDPAAMLAAQHHAAERGIYTVDAVTGDRGLAEQYERIVATERQALLVAPKTIFDPRFAQLVADRHAIERVPTTVLTERMDEVSEAILRRAGVPMLKPKEGAPEMHANLVMGSGLRQAAFGTAWISPRALGRPDVPNLFAGKGRVLAPQERWARSREVGVVASDPDSLATIRRAIEELDAAPHDFRADAARLPADAA